MVRLFLYSTVTGLVFAQLYFPKSSHAAALLLAWGIYAVGFIARPVGAAIFGHFGDRIGRKSTLIISLTLMGLATVLVGCVPPYDSVGIWGAVSLTILRFMQGVALGGEWGGSILLSMEWNRLNGRRGLVASIPQLGVPMGLLLVNLAMLASSQLLSNDQFFAWGWRVPFWLSAVLAAIGLIIRRGIIETPVFMLISSRQKIERTPIVGVVKRYYRTIILCSLTKAAEQVPFYIFTAFVFAYGVETLKLSRDFILAAVCASAALSLVSTPLFGFYSDQIGRRKMYIYGAGVMGAFAFAYFAMLNSGSQPLVFVAIVLSLIPHSMMFGPQAALIAESFPSNRRYSGTSLGYQLSSIFAGGPAPLLAAWLAASFGSGYAVATYVLLCSLVSITACLFMQDYTGKEIER
jgi:MFS family permease